MAPRRESPKNKARKPHKATAANRKTANKTQNVEKVRKVRTECGTKRGPEKRESTHGYNLRRPSSSVVVLAETCACSEGDRRRLHRLHLHSNQCSSLSKSPRRRQSHISVVTVSSEEDEHMGLERAAKWVESVDFERGEEVGFQGDVQRESQTELRERGRAGGGGGSEPEPMVVDPSLLEEGVHMETDSVLLLPPTKATSPSEQFEIACAMNLSADLAQEMFRPLCVSTPEAAGPISPRTMEVPGAANIPFGDSAGLNPEMDDFRFVLDLPRVGDYEGLPATSVNPEPEAFRFALDRPRLGDSAELATTSANQENSQLFFDLPRIGDFTEDPAASVNPQPNTPQFIFGPAKAIRQLWPSFASPLGSPISYEFGMSGIKRFEPAISGRDLEVEGERKRKRSLNQVASTSTSPVPRVLYEPDNY